MSLKTLNIKSTGVFDCVVSDGIEFAAIDVTDPRIDVRYQNLLQEMIDEIQSQNLQEIHMEANLTSQFVHKVGVGNFVVEDNPSSYELFATMKEWTHRLQEED